jgi:hypothetical protein
MNASSDASAAHLSTAQRRAVYGIIISIAIGIVCARISNITRDGKTPMLSANDRSRWCTIRALVDYGTFAVDEVIYDENGKRIAEWQTIDLVQHRNIDGEPRYYSSKPPLVPALLSIPYGAVKWVTGTTMGEQPMFVIRILLLIINIPCFALLLWWTTQLVERYGKSDWGRILVVATAAYGTFLTPFSATLNNHLFAAVGVMGCLVGILKIGRERDAPWWCFIGTGLAAGFAAANELPATSLLCLVAAAAAIRNPARGICGTWVGGGIVVIAFFIVNVAAHHSLRPPYAHRGLGESLTVMQDANFNVPEKPTAAEIKRLMPDYQWPLLAAKIEEVSEDRLALWDRSGPFLALQRGKAQWTVHAWDDWYDYPIDKTGSRARSYWKRQKKGVDNGESSRATYAFHMLIGHHGVFSLTPLWLLSFAGLAMQIRCRDERRWVALSVLLMTGVCIAFYLMRPEIDRNYGGVSSGFRWMFWFIPFWLFALLPVVDRAAKYRSARIACHILLALSTFSATYALNNPWSHPWLFNYWTWLQWINYS